MLDTAWRNKIMSSIEEDYGTGCWLWSGRWNSNGVPILVVEKRDRKTKYRKATTYRISRILYEWEFGEIPVRYLDNVCGNSKCVNPDHFQPRTFDVRFWGNVSKPDGEDGCWLWKGTLFDTGYGSVSIDGESCLTHRVSYEQVNGKIPEGMMVLHSCHNRNCINPDHLRVGTHDDNMRDMTDADRQAKGEMDGNSKLVEEEVQEIKRLLSTGQFTHKQIARMFGVARPTITDIRSGRTWKERGS